VATGALLSSPVLEACGNTAVRGAGENRFGGLLSLQARDGPGSSVHQGDTEHKARPPNVAIQTPALHLRKNGVFNHHQAQALHPRRNGAFSHHQTPALRLTKTESSIVRHKTALKAVVCQPQTGSACCETDPSEMFTLTADIIKAALGVLWLKLFKSPAGLTDSGRGTVPLVKVSTN